MSKNLCLDMIGGMYIKRVITGCLLLGLGALSAEAQAPAPLVPPPDLNHQNDYIFPSPARIQAAASVGPAPLSESLIDSPQLVSYTAFDGTHYSLTQYTGKYTAILLQDSWNVALTMDEKRSFVDRADLLYQHYRDILGAEPPGGAILTIAVVKTCGYGCGYVGAKNIELADDSSAMANFKADMDAGNVVKPLPHEMAHNFDIYNNYQSYWSDQSHAWTSFWDRYILVYMQEGDTNNSPKQILNSAIDDLYLTYLNSTNTWSSCLKLAACVAPVTQNSAWAGIMFQVAKLHGVPAIRGAMSFMKSYVAANPAPSTPEAKEDLHIQALAAGAALNLGCYVDAWRWYASPALRSTMSAQFGPINPFCQDLDHDGYSRLTGDTDDLQPTVHPGATESLNGIDDDSDGIIDDTLYTETPNGDFPANLPIHFPARITGRITNGDADRFYFNLPAPGKVQFTIRSTPDFQGFLFLFQQGSNNWYKYEYVYAGMNSAISWDLPAAGQWSFSVELNSASLPGSYTAEIYPLPRWPRPWAATAVPATGPPYHLSGATQTLADIDETPDSIRYWITGIGLVGSTPYSANAALDWIPPAGTVPGAYAYRVQLMSGLKPIADMSSPVYFNVGAQPSPPTVDAATPSAGSGTTQTFALQYSDSNGYSDLAQGYVLFNSSLTAANACYVYYDRAANRLYLENDAGTSFFAFTTVGAGSLSNSQCTVNGAGSSVSGAGNTLTLNLAITFAPSFAGTKTSYMFATDTAGAYSNWQVRGSWMVPFTGVNVAPTADSTTPSAGSGTTQTFALKYSDGNGYNDLAQAYVLFNASLTAANGCYVYYDRAANRLYLENDAGTSFSTFTTVGAGSLSNSQCTVNGAASSVTGSGNTLTLNLAITFAPAFAGTKTIYMFATDSVGAYSNWQIRGSWTVPSGGVNVAPTADSATPGAGSGTTQTFALKYSDGNGYTNLAQGFVLFNASLTATNGCYVYYDRAANRLYLENDAGTSFSTFTTVGAGSLSNSQCTVNGAGSSVTGSGNTLTLNLAIIFTPDFAGTKAIYMFATDAAGAYSNWQVRGSWIIPSGGVNVAPTVDSATTGAGLVVLKYSDGNGYSDLAQGYVLINSSLTAANGCYVYYDRAANRLYLENDAGTSFSTFTTIGLGSLSNSQCTVNGAGSSVSGTGDTLTLNLAITFAPAFAGTKTIYMFATDAAGAYSNWQVRGTL